jgi:hypothetical protein
MHCCFWADFPTGGIVQGNMIELYKTGEEN